MNQRFSEGVECLINIRVSSDNRMPHQKLTAILKGQIPFEDKYIRYFTSFFEEVSPKLMYEYMREESISKEQVLAIYQQMPKLAEFHKFTKLVQSGNFGTGSYKKFD